MFWKPWPVAGHIYSHNEILNLHKVVYSVFYSNSNASQVSFRQDVLIIVSSWIFLVLARHDLSFDILEYNIEHYFHPRSFFISDRSNKSSILKRLNAQDRSWSVANKMQFNVVAENVRQESERVCLYCALWLCLDVLEVPFENIF